MEVGQGPNVGCSAKGKNYYSGTTITNKNLIQEEIRGD
jgi:hypothetical protein